jgi:hypothetical protein
VSDPVLKPQRGLGIFGLLLIVAIAAAIGWYAYKGMTGAGEPESCNEAFNHCMKTCRRTTTEAPAAQACQEACRSDLAACASK